MNEILFDTIRNAGAAIKTKQISPVELTKLTLNQIQEHEPILNAFITVMAEEAMEQAKLLEKEIEQNQYRGPLHGIPIAVKDILQTKGVKTTNGSKIFDGFVPNDDATVIKKLKEAGAIIIGKANLHEFAMGATTENPHYGSTKNPWDLSKIPGGSSGGSAVLTATGMAFGAVGTDTAGSVRLPAAMCGTVGFKPTYGLVSRKGCFPFSWSLDHVGPMTRKVENAAIMLEAMRGFDPDDPSTVNRNVSVIFDQTLDLKGVKLGFYEPYMFAGIDEGVKQVIDQAFHQLESLGAEIVTIDLPGIDQALNALKSIAQSEVVSVHEPFLKEYGHLYGDDLKYRFEFGSEVSASTYIQAQRIREKLLEKRSNKCWNRCISGTN